MKDLWQSVCEKIESKDLILKNATLRELEKEIGLVAIQGNLQFLFNDINFDCNMYKLKIHLKTELDQTELTKHKP